MMVLDNARNDGAHPAADPIARVVQCVASNGGVRSAAKKTAPLPPLHHKNNALFNHGIRLTRASPAFVARTIATARDLSVDHGHTGFGWQLLVASLHFKLHQG